MDILIILIVALIIDTAFREPCNTWHPVAWLGKLISIETKLARDKGKSMQLFLGTIIVLITIAAITITTYFLLLYLRDLNWWIYLILAGLLLKFTFSLRGLRQAATEVKIFLLNGKMTQARNSLQALVSRDTSRLNKKQIISATVESITENSCDSFIAPLFYFLLFGIPGAIAYRVINTYDAMIGYHGEWEYTGKFAAKLDDIANFIPARITALMIVLAALLCRKNSSKAWQIMLRDHKKTESPNAGWTMSAMAGAIGIKLEKPKHHKLGGNHYTLSPEIIDASQKLIIVVACIWSFVLILIEVLYIVT
ncbi:cobalamin biosynthesis protein [Chloroflexota bacterium]